MGRDWVLSPEVALLAEGVDRNTIATSKTGCVQASPSSRRAWIEITVFSPLRIFSHVALLAEGVDRNFSGRFVSPERQVALLAEGVDRNRKPARPLYGLTPSPSSRRAWIEIRRYNPSCVPRPVALLAEGVDRNNTLHARLHQQGVDRNVSEPFVPDFGIRRPPRGGRG